MMHEPELKMSRSQLLTTGVSGLKVSPSGMMISGTLLDFGSDEIHPGDVKSDQSVMDDIEEPTSVIRLNNGNYIPQIGLGTGNPKGFPCEPTVIDALEVGYRHFDTAFVYNNQEQLGAALKKGMFKHEIRREEIFVTTKIWNTHHTRERVWKNCETSLRMLQMEYVDLLLMHFPIAFLESDVHFPRDENGKLESPPQDVDYLETWRGMEDCLNRGWAKSIGVSNFNKQQLERLLSNCNIAPAVLQVEAHPYLPQKELLEFCKQNSIVLVAYATLGVPKPKVMPDGSVAKLNVHVLDDPVIAETAAKYERSPGQILLRWAIQRGTVPIPRTTQKHRLTENYEALEFSLDDEDMDKINQLDCNVRAYKFSHFQGMKHFFLERSTSYENNLRPHTD